MLHSGPPSMNIVKPDAKPRRQNKDGPRTAIIQRCFLSAVRLMFPSVTSFVLSILILWLLVLSSPSICKVNCLAIMRAGGLRFSLAKARLRVQRRIGIRAWFFWYTAYVGLADFGTLSLKRFSSSWHQKDTLSLKL